MTPLDVDELPIAWRECGSGPVVVFLHGIGGSRTAWDPQLVGLGHRFRCVAWDMPSYGASAPATSVSFEAVADALAAFVARLDAGPVHLVGESFGGMHALHAATRYPELMSRMVVTNTSPAFGLDGTDPESWRTSRVAALDDGVPLRSVAENVFARIAGPALAGDALRARIDAFARIGESGFRAAVDVLPEHDLLSSLASITTPTLVIAGELDRETPPSYARRLAAGLADAELAIIDGVGHIAASEAPDEFNRLVAEFLSREDH